jgi:hypothetical protein
MPDIYETDTTRTFGRETPHVSDAPQISPAMPGGEVAASSWRSRLSWAAILAGVVIALLAQLFLNLIGMAFGAASLAPLSGAGASPTAVSTGAGIWFAISTILSALAGGYAAARFAGAPNESNGGWHGLTTWALTALVLTYLVGSAVAGLLGGLGGAARTTASTTVAAPALAQLADPFSSIEQQVQSATAGNDPAALRQAAVSSLRSALTSNEPQAAQARERAAQAIAKAENISVENARTQVQNYEQQYRQAVDNAKQQAKRAADEAARAVSGASWLGALSLLLGGLAGWIGGRSAAGNQPLRERLASATGRARR